MPNDILRKGSFWRETYYFEYPSRCSSCGKKRSTSDRAKALRNDDVCEKCKRSKIISEDQQTLF